MQGVQGAYPQTVSTESQVPAVADAVVAGYLTGRAASGQVNERAVEQLDYPYSRRGVNAALQRHGTQALLRYGATVDELAMVDDRAGYDAGTYLDGDTSIYRLLEDRLADRDDAAVDADATTANPVRRQEYADQQEQFAFATDAWDELRDDLSLVRQGGYMTVSYTPSDRSAVTAEHSGYRLPEQWDVDTLL